MAISMFPVVMTSLLLQGVVGWQVRTGPGDATSPGNPVQVVGYSPVQQGPALAIDDDPNTAFAAATGGGFCVTPAAEDTKIGFLVVATIKSTQDPIAFELYGSRVRLEGPYDLIAAGDLEYREYVVPGSQMTLNLALAVIDPKARYHHYQVLFPLARDYGDRVQVAEVELLPAYDWRRPFPKDLASDVPRDTALRWHAWRDDVVYDVYLGTQLSDVSNADRDNPLGVAVSRGQDANSFDPNRLELDTTYHWRVDEVNCTPDSTVFKGPVWRFTAEPSAYPITQIRATASSCAGTDTGPEKTIDYSGLNAADEHSAVDTDMWTSDGEPGESTWIRYDFDRLYKLGEVRIWNYNGMLEPYLGLGVKDVTIAYTADGCHWTVLGDYVIDRAPGASGYEGSPLSLDGVVAKAVLINVHSNWGNNTSSQYGLSEVRFLYLPTFARAPQPASGTADVDVNTILTWRPGREAVSHEVYFSPDETTVVNNTALVGTVTAAAFDPGPLDLAVGTTYYWKVVEVNQAETPSAWDSDLWSFTTSEYVTIDDIAYPHPLPAGSATRIASDESR